MVPFVLRLYHEQNRTGNIIDTPNNILKEKDSFKKNFLSIFANKFLFRFCIVGIVFGIAEGATLSHFVVFLSEDLDMSKAMVGLIFGMLVSPPLFGLIADIYRGYQLSWLFFGFTIKKSKRSYLTIFHLQSKANISNA
jgi:Na+/melibiose symporter-like transporter